MANSDAMYNAMKKPSNSLKTRLIAILRDHPEYKREFYELAYNGESLADIYEYFNNRRLREINDKILTEMGL